MLFMSVDTFNREQFEAALPRDKATGLNLWSYMGFVKGEHVYAINVNERIHILVRSTIDASGVSAPCGEDSIRLWLAEIGSERPLMGKLTRWVTRVPGWQARITEQARQLYRISRKLKPHPACNKIPVIRRSKTKREDGNEYFIKCVECDTFIGWTQLD